MFSSRPILFDNVSYGATVGEIAATCSTLIKIKNLPFTPVLNKFYVHCDFSKWFIDYLQNANECSIISAVSTTCIFSAGKKRTCIFQHARQTNMQTFD